MAVTSGISKLSLEFSHPTYQTAYEPFTPNESGQRSPPTYYRGCWHVVGRGFFCRYRLDSSLLKGVYNPKAFIPHAALLRQAFAHCGKFPTAASRRSLGRVSVPVWLIILSDQLMIVALVSFYLTNKLIIRRPFPKRRSFAPKRLCGISYPFGQLFLTLGYVPTRYSAVRRSCTLHSLFDLPSSSLESGMVLLPRSNTKCRALPL